MEPAESHWQEPIGIAVIDSGCDDNCTAITNIEKVYGVASYCEKVEVIDGQTQRDAQKYKEQTLCNDLVFDPVILSNDLIVELDSAGAMNPDVNLIDASAGEI